MREIEYCRASTIREAVAYLAEDGRQARVLAGGTDILVTLRTGRRQADRLVDVKAIPELNELSCGPRTGLTLGAAVPCYRIYGNAAVREAYPGLIDAVELIGSVQIQGRATVGGNLCNAAPSADTAPVLIALGATCLIAGPNGTRRVPVEEVCTGPGQTILQKDELLVSFHLPFPVPNSGAHYLRFIPRNEMDIAVAGAGVSVVLDERKTTFKAARIALAAVAPTPLLVREAGDFLVGRRVTEGNVREAARLAREAARPITDMRGTVEYRRHLCEVLTKRALERAIARAKGTDR